MRSPRGQGAQRSGHFWIRTSAKRHFLLNMPLRHLSQYLALSSSLNQDMLSQITTILTGGRLSLCGPHPTRHTCASLQRRGTTEPCRGCGPGRL